MFQKILLHEILLIFLTIHLFDQTNCKNSNKVLSCYLWGESFGYEKFTINFYYSTREQTQPQRVTPKKIISGDIDIDLKKRTVVIVHGLAPSTYKKLMYNLRSAFLEWSDVNIIYVDWEEGCDTPLHYRQASRNTEYTAIRIKDFFQDLMKAWNGTNKSKKYWGPLHFIGISLGAHVVGQAAEFLKDKGQPFVYRVTGLDPAEPCFNDFHSPLRIRKSNAKYVDIVHTDAARSDNTGLGLFEPIGHVDFYVNGGSSQPGCSIWRKKRSLKVFKVGYHIIAQSGRCHHLRSIEIFTESLKNAASKQCKFWGQPWQKNQLYANTRPRNLKQRGNTSIEMGINAELYDRYGIFYVPTTGTAPYCKA